MTVSDRMSETVTAEARANASAAKNEPMTPLKNPSGAKTTMVVSVDDVTGPPSTVIADLAASAILYEFPDSEVRKALEELVRYTTDRNY